MFLINNVSAQTIEIKQAEDFTNTISNNFNNKLDIINVHALNGFFEKLYDIEKFKKDKVRIVQIGDSHIQADFSSNIIKDAFQQKFGNAGLGFVFPHKLAKTNGTSNVNFNSNGIFSSSRNVRPIDDNPIGISGYSLLTNDKNAVIQVTIKNIEDYANSIKIITPNNESFFDLSLKNNNSFNLKKQSTKPITHKVKPKETLSSIAKMHNVSVSFIMKQNGLKSSKIGVGKVLKVGNKSYAAPEISTSDFDIVDLQTEGKSNDYNSKTLVDNFYLIPNKNKTDFVISGLLLENEKFGITYSGIGVNGAKLSDYNNFDMFFDQMQVLKPNLLIISLGTNESFDRLSSSDYIHNLDVFIKKLKQFNPEVTVLITTPPPSTLHKKYENIYIADYTNEIINYALENKTIAVYNMYQALGGIDGVKLNKQKGFLAKDEVHYTKDGYQEQGKILADALLNAYQNYISNK